MHERAYNNSSPHHRPKQLGSMPSDSAPPLRHHGVARVRCQESRRRSSATASASCSSSDSGAFRPTSYTSPPTAQGAVPRAFLGATFVEMFGGQRVVRDTSSYRAVMRQQPARCGAVRSRCDIKRVAIVPGNGRQDRPMQWRHRTWVPRSTRPASSAHASHASAAAPSRSTRRTCSNVMSSCSSSLGS